MTGDNEILVNEFESFGPDAPFFAEVKRRRQEKESERKVLVSAIERSVKRRIQ